MIVQERTAPMAWIPYVAALTLAASCARPSPVLVATDRDDARVDAVITFQRDEVVESQFALRAPPRVGWRAAPTIAVPTTSSWGYTANGAPDSSQRPLLVLVRSEVRERPQIRVSIVTVGSGRLGGTLLGGAPATGSATRPCVGESWLTAFFLEGLGPRPTAPATLYVRSGGSLYSLRIDHERDLLRASPALRVSQSDVLPGLSHGEGYSASFQAARTLSGALPLIVYRENRGWSGNGGSGPGGRWGMHFTHDAGSQGPSEWHVFVLDPPLPCTDTE